MARLLSQNVVSVRAAHQLEMSLRQLRFHAFLSLVAPRPDRLGQIEEDQQAFEEGLRLARQASTTSEELDYLEQIEAGYGRYRAELDQLQTQVAAGGPRMDFEELAEQHPIRHLIAPCRELSRINEAVMDRTAAENADVSGKAQAAMLLLGVLGPAGGLLAGYGIARGLKRELLRAEQLAAVGQLAASVAHEVRNPLTAVKLLVEAALRSHNRKPLTVEDLEVIHGEVARLEQTVQQLLDFARPSAPQRDRCDLRDVVGPALDLVRGAGPASRRLRRSAAAPPSRCRRRWTAASGIPYSSTCFSTRWTPCRAAAGWRWPWRRRPTACASAFPTPAPASRRRCRAGCSRRSPAASRPAPAWA